MTQQNEIKNGEKSKLENIASATCGIMAGVGLTALGLYDLRLLSYGVCAGYGTGALCFGGFLSEEDGYFTVGCSIGAALGGCLGAYLGYDFNNSKGVESFNSRNEPDGVILSGAAIGGILGGLSTTIFIEEGKSSKFVKRFLPYATLSSALILGGYFLRDSNEEKNTQPVSAKEKQIFLEKGQWKDRKNDK